MLMGKLKKTVLLVKLKETVRVVGEVERNCVVMGEVEEKLYC